MTGRGAYWAEGSFNFHVHKNLSALTGSMWTAWTVAPEQSAAVRYDWSDTPLTYPCFSVTHLDTDEKRPGLAQQRSVSPTGGRYADRSHLTEISCWHARFSGNGVARPGWPAQLRQMRDMVGQLFTSAQWAPLLNLDSATAHPFVTAGQIRFRGFRELPVAPDPNPGIVRRRVLVEWEHREDY